MLADLLSPNVAKQLANAGNLPPDNAIGNSGDFYYRIPVDGSEIQLYQKTGNVWNSIFNLPLSGSVTKATQTITADENGMATLTDPPDFPIFTVYHEGGYTIPAQYDNLSRILSGLNPNEEHTIYMI